MFRIYFDKQIYSYLFNQREDRYVVLREKILKHSRDFVFVYSDAHIQDLKRSDESFAKKELEFMESIVNNNYLKYDYDNGQPKPLPVTPSIIFDATVDYKSTAQDYSLQEVVANQDLALVFINTARIINSIAKGEIDCDWFSQSSNIVESYTEEELSQAYITCITFFNLGTSKDNYKRIRDTAFNFTKDNISIPQNGDTSFNEELKSTPFGLSYLELIKSSLEKSGYKDTKSLSCVTMAYTMLDVTGINREKGKTVEYWNLTTDAHHCYYASLCDCVVSNDKKFLDKTRIIYNLLNINTQVLHIDDFITAFDEHLNSEDIWSVDKLIDEVNILFNDQSNDVGFVDLQHLYLGYFSKARKITKNDRDFVVLTRNHLDRECVIAYNEIKIIVDRLVSMFGDDGYGRGVLELSKLTELEDITKWQGRMWGFNDYFMEIVFHQAPYGLSLIIEKNS